MFPFFKKVSRYFAELEVIYQHKEKNSLVTELMKKQKNLKNFFTEMNPNTIELTTNSVVSVRVFRTVCYNVSVHCAD